MSLRPCDCPGTTNPACKSEKTPPTPAPPTPAPPTAAPPTPAPPTPAPPTLAPPTPAPPTPAPPTPAPPTPSPPTPEPPTPAPPTYTVPMCNATGLQYLDSTIKVNDAPCWCGTRGSSDLCNEGFSCYHD